MLNMRSFVFFLVTGGLSLAFHVYLYRRLVRDTTQSARLRRIGVAACGLLWTVFIFTRFLQSRTSPSWWGIPAFAATWLWIAFAAYAALALGVFELVRFLPQKRGAEPDPDRRQFLARAAAGGAVAFAGGLTHFGVWRAFEAPEISELSLKLPRLPRVLDGLTIVQLSDLHINSATHQKFLFELVRRCNDLQPDLVAITGDLVDGRVNSLGGTVSALAHLRSRYGTYFVTGNHDYYSGDREWCKALSQMGINVLRNQRVQIGDAAGSLDLIGVDDWGARGRYRGSGYDLERALHGRDSSRAAVLLAHRPSNFEEAVAKGIDLQLSGHTHGGQFFPITMLVPLFWSRYAGLYEYGSGKLYVSRGTGFWGPPLRSNPPEIVKVALTA